MASTGAFLFPAGVSSTFLTPSAGNSKLKSNPVSVSVSTRRLALSAEQPPATTKWTDGELKNGRFDKKGEEEAHSHTSTIIDEEYRQRQRRRTEHQVLEERMSLKDFFEQAKDLIKSDGGPPRWFSPLECGSRLNNSPLLLFLPG